MRIGAKRRKHWLAGPWLERLLPAMTEVMLAFALVSTTLLAVEIGRSGEPAEPAGGSHYAPTASAPLA